jgi:hypothetical protein
MEHLIERLEKVLVGFEQIFKFFGDLMQQAQEAEAEEKEYQEKRKQEKSRYKYGHMTAFWIKKVDDGNACLQELINSRDYYVSSRAEKGYPIDKSYHGPMAEAIEVLQARSVQLQDVA